MFCVGLCSILGQFSNHHPLVLDVSVALIGVFVPFFRSPSVSHCSRTAIEKITRFCVDAFFQELVHDEVVKLLSVFCTDMHDQFFSS